MLHVGVYYKSMDKKYVETSRDEVIIDPSPASVAGCTHSCQHSLNWLVLFCHLWLVKTLVVIFCHFNSLNYKMLSNQVCKCVDILQRANKLTSRESLPSRILVFTWQ